MLVRRRRQRMRTSGTIEPVKPVVRAVLRAATESAGASRGWIVALKVEQLQVVDAVGADIEMLIKARVPAAAGIAGFVVGSGQPIALTARSNDPRLAQGLTRFLAHPPTSFLSVPCATDEGVVGALELADKAGGGGFTFDDVELASLLAGIAAAAITSDLDSLPLPDPRQLAAELVRLADVDPTRYAAIATALRSLLAGA